MNIPEPALLKSKKGKSSQQVELHIGCIYDEIRSIINQVSLHLSLEIKP